MEEGARSGLAPRKTPRAAAGRRFYVSRACIRVCELHPGQVLLFASQAFRGEQLASFTQACYIETCLGPLVEPRPVGFGTRSAF